MARIRTVKPEFWEDETVGTLSRDARLLFIATFNMADDEGLLRWTVAYIKAQAFVYDEDLSATRVGELMNELATAGLVYPYRGGKAQQQLGMIVNFHRHQRVNRPQPSKLPPPSLQLHVTRAMYARRDGYICHLCGYPTNETPALVVGPTKGLGDLDFSPDHVIPRSAGGSDYPGNIRNSHISCNKGRGDRAIESFTMPRPVASALGLSESVRLSATGSVNEDVNHSVNESVTDSLPEGKGREGKGREGSTRATTRAKLPTPDTWTGPTDKHKAQATELELDLKFETDKFLDSWRARGVKYKDPDAAFRNWLRQSAKWGGSTNSPNTATAPASRRHVPLEVPSHIDPDDGPAYAAWLREAAK